MSVTDPKSTAPRPSGRMIDDRLNALLGEAGQPLSTGHLRQRLAAELHGDIVTETVYRRLVALEREGSVVRLCKVGRNTLWSSPSGVCNDSAPTTAPDRLSRLLGPRVKWLQDRFLDANSDCIKIVRGSGELAYMNKAGCEALGVPTGHAEFGMSWLELLPEHVRDEGSRALRTALQGDTTRFAGLSMSPEGAVQYWDNSLTPIQREDGRIREILCVSRNMTEHRDALQRVQAASESDDLTGVWNRRAFHNRAAKALLRSFHDGTSVGLLMLDLDNFKPINDIYGHSAGDQILKSISGRVARYLRQSRTGFVARLGGDEFAVVANIADDMDLCEIAMAISSLADEPVHYRGVNIAVTMTVGGATYPRDAQSLSGLLRCADAALYDAKIRCPGGLQLFTQDLAADSEKLSRQLGLARRLLRSDALVPHYQPRVSLETGELVGFDTCIRWTDDNGRDHGPESFAAAFGNHRVATNISEVIHAKVLADVAGWVRDGLGVADVTFDATPADFQSGDFVQRLLQKIDAHQILRTKIHLRVSETALTGRGSTQVIAALGHLQSAGVGITLDRFGSSYRTIELLQHGVIDGLVVDCDLFKRARTDPRALAIARSIQCLGDGLGLAVLAHGIDDFADLRLAKNIGFTHGQGDYFGPATESRDTARILRKHQISTSFQP